MCCPTTQMSRCQHSHYIEPLTPIYPTAIKKRQADNLLRTEEILHKMSWRFHEALLGKCKQESMYVMTWGCDEMCHFHGGDSLPEA